MSKGVGSTFQKAAVAPLDQSANWLGSGKIESGLDSLARESLIGAVRRGVEAVAKATGVGGMEVYGHLPMAELDAHVARIDSHRRQLSNAWVEHPSEPGREAMKHSAGDLVARLEALAESSGADEQITREAGALATELSAWREAITACRSTLVKIPELRRALRRRARVQQALLLVALGIFATGAIGYKRLRSARGRVDAKLAAGVCEVENIATSDLQLAAEAQQARVREARTTCQRERETQRAALEKQRVAEEAQQKAKAARKAKLARCKALGERFAAKALDASDKELAGSAADVLERLANGQLAPADVSTELGALPCAGTPAGKAVRERLAASIVALGPLWLPNESLPAATREMLVAHRDAVTEAQWIVFGAQLEQAADRAVQSGQKEVISRYAKLCHFKAAVKLEQGGTCGAVLDLEKGD